LTDAYRSAPIPDPRGEGVVVVHCSDPRYQPHFNNFVRDGLKLDRYSLIAIPGGAQPLTLVEYLPKFAWSGWRWMKFLATLAPLRQVVLIAHDDCRWYFEHGFVKQPEALRARQIDDMRRTAAEIRERFGEVRVDCYIAALGQDGTRFEKV
jgi:hypothetical protein